MSLSVAEPQWLAKPELPDRCVNHGGVTAVASCEACGRRICEVCAFRFGGAAWCADCMTAGPSAEVREATTTRAVLSIVLGVLGFIVLIANVVLGAAGGVPDGAATVLGMVWLGCGSGGLAFALIAREGKTGSVLPTMGIVVNGLLMAVTAALMVLGSMS